MHRDFRLADLGRVRWGATAKLATARGFAAGLVWAAALAIPVDGWGDSALLALPFACALAALPIGLGFRIVGGVVPIAGPLLAAAGASLTVLGDPLVYVVNRWFPRAFNVADFRLMQVQPLIFVTYPS